MFLKLFKKNIRQDNQGELRYWRKQLNTPEAIQSYLERYHLIKKLFPEKYLQNVNKVADIGSGPFGGIFSVSKWPAMVAVDPLWDEYEKAFPGLAPEEVIHLAGVAESLPQDNFDLIWAINSLDHSGNIRKSLDHLVQCLAPQGKLFLHVHMRRRDQLNKTHQMIIQEKDIRSCGHWEWENITPNCPIEGKPYRTWVGVLIKEGRMQ